MASHSFPSFYLSSLERKRKRSEDVSGDVDQASSGIIGGLQSVMALKRQLDGEAEKKDDKDYARGRDTKADARADAESGYRDRRLMLEEALAKQRATSASDEAARKTKEDERKAKEAARSTALGTVKSGVTAGLSEGLDDRALIERLSATPGLEAAGINWQDVSGESAAQRRAREVKDREMAAKEAAANSPIRGLREENVVLQNEQLRKNLNKPLKPDEKAVELDDAAGRVDSLIDRVSKTGTGLGTAARNVAGRLPIVGDMADPGAEARTLYNEIESFKSAELKRLSGAGVSDNERRAFNSFNANIGSTTTTALAALETYKREIERARAARQRATVAPTAEAEAPAQDDEDPFEDVR